MNLGKLGIFQTIDHHTSEQSADLAKLVEELGYSALWTSEGIGRDVLLSSSWLLANTSSLIVAAGIANVYARDPMTMVAAQLGLNEQSDGRFLLGIGVSVPEINSDIRGHAPAKPLATMRAYLESMKTMTFIGPRHAEVPKTVLAAIGPKMLAMAGADADGAHPYNVTPEHTAEARRILGPGKLLCVEQKAILEQDSSKARSAAREVEAWYIHAANYQKAWRAAGFTDDDFDDGGSDRLIDAVVAWGNLDDIMLRIQQHWEAGADHVCVQTIDPDAPTTESGMANRDEKLMRALAAFNG
jgi:probable F420-dependent oxidoreductase